MSLSIWTALLFWAFILGFWSGISFPVNRQKQKQITSEALNGGYDFYISDKEYENFLSYDGTTQKKEWDYGKQK